MSISSLQTPAAIRQFRHSLLAWYETHQRPLPWRMNRDPYRVWISEIMLQQTRVAAVLDHYARFLKRFPDIASLAAAKESEVLTAWSGLGYYRRARMMHRAAQLLANENWASLPRSAAELRHLPGIGRYTANAIASIAFGEAVAVVDGNVERVVTRLSGKTVTTASLWDEAERLLDVRKPGEFNQAMMELGAMVCTPLAPLCAKCPVKRWCASNIKQSFAKGRRIPSRLDRSPNRRLRRTACLSLQRRNGAVLLRQRSAREALMPGMWELPELAHRVRQKPLLTVKHTITTTDWTVQVFASGRAQRSRATRWTTIPELTQLPLTGLTRKVLRKLGVLA